MVQDILAMTRRYRAEVALFFVSFALHAAFVGAIQYLSGAHGFISYSDAEYFFLRLASNLVEHGAFSLAREAPYVPDAYHTPLYPLMFAAFLAVRSPLWSIALAQGIAASATVVLTYRIAHELTASRRLAFVAGGIALIEPAALYWGGILVTDTLFAFLVTAAVYALMRRRFFVLGIALGLATLTRPLMLYLSPFFFIMGAYIARTTAVRPLRDAYRGPLIAIVLMTLVVFPWSLHNKLSADTWSLSSAGWEGLYYYPLLAFVERYDLDVPQEGAPPTLDFSDFSAFNFEYVPFYRNSFVALVSAHPAGYVLVHAERALASIVSNRYDYLVEVVLRSELPTLYATLTPTGIALVYAIGIAFWMIVYALFVSAFLEKHTRAWWFFAAAIIILNFVIAGAIQPDGGSMSRYLLCVQPLLIAFAAVGVQALARLWNAAARGQ